jgi:hypothetical protein
MSEKKFAKTRRFFSVTLGPVEMVKQSFGSNVGSTAKDSFKILQETNKLDVESIKKTHEKYSLEAKCAANKVSEKQVRAAYRNTLVVQSCLLGALVIMIGFITLKDLSVGGWLLSVLGASMAFILFLSCGHHQLAIREKVFLMPKDILEVMLFAPQKLLPQSLPRGWRLFEAKKATAKPEAKGKIVVRKRERDDKE